MHLYLLNPILNKFHHLSAIWIISSKKLVRYDYYNIRSSFIEKKNLLVCP